MTQDAKMAVQIPAWGNIAQRRINEQEERIIALEEQMKILRDLIRNLSKGFDSNSHS